MIVINTQDEALIELLADQTFSLTRDYKLVQTVAVMSSSRKVDVVVPDSVAERRDEQKKVLRR